MGSKWSVVGSLEEKTEQPVMVSGDQRFWISRGPRSGPQRGYAPNSARPTDGEKARGARLPGPFPPATRRAERPTGRSACGTTAPLGAGGGVAPKVVPRTGTVGTVESLPRKPWMHRRVRAGLRGRVLPGLNSHPSRCAGTSHQLPALALLRRAIFAPSESAFRGEIDEIGNQSRY